MSREDRQKMFALSVPLSSHLRRETQHAFEDAHAPLEQVSARRVALSRSVAHHALKQTDTNAKLSSRIRDLSQQLSRYGYRGVAACLNIRGKDVVMIGMNACFAW